MTSQGFRRWEVTMTQRPGTTSRSQSHHAGHFRFARAHPPYMTAQAAQLPFHWRTISFFPARPEQYRLAAPGTGPPDNRVDLNRGPDGYGDCIPVLALGEGAFGRTPEAREL